MLSSPVFTATVWQQGKRAYPSFTRTLLQTRDLLVWICVKLGLVAMDQRHELMEVPIHTVRTIRTAHTRRTSMRN